jgi:ATP-dependent DNA helicase DinG
MSSSTPQRTGSPAKELDAPGKAAAHASPEGIARELRKKARARLEFLYSEVARTWPGFIARPGQHQLMHAALLTFLCARSPDDERRPGNNLAQLEAGTGTGKTVAYCLAAIVASELLKKTVIVSTATVALQEQLFHKDLPRLAKVIPDLRFDLLKGRGRYICESRLEGALNDEAQDSLAGDGFQESFAGASWQARGAPHDAVKAMRWYKTVARKLRGGQWDGDIDSLVKPPDSEDWRKVQANASACNGGQCEHFKSCGFFRARRRAASATIQVANHALILATLQTDSALVDAGNTLFVFDEAHHLPDIAAEQFSYRARLGTSANLLAGLRTVAHRHSRDLPASTRPDLTALGEAITECTNKLAILEDWWIRNHLVSADKPVHRFAQGQVPEALIPECEQLGTLIRSIATVVAGIAAALTLADESRSPADREQQARAGVELGVYLARLDTLDRLFGAWATHDTVPWAKWLEYCAGSTSTSTSTNAGTVTGAASVDVLLCASPMTAAQHLARGLWNNVSAAVCTSATLTACGSFDFFDRMSGMNRFADRRSLVVASPFDYARQGELRIAAMSHSPKSPEFSDELCRTRASAWATGAVHLEAPVAGLSCRSAARPERAGVDARRALAH